MCDDCENIKLPRGWLILAMMTKSEDATKAFLPKPLVTRQGYIPLIDEVNGMSAPNDDSFRGHHQFIDDAGNPYGSFEVFYADETVIGHLFDIDQELVKPDEAVGWYWWTGFPGCLPDGDPHGPFPTSEGAYLDAIGD